RPDPPWCSRRGGQRAGDDEDHRISHIARNLAREDRMRRYLDLDVRWHARRRQGPEMAYVGCRQHEANAGHRAYAGEIADPETRMRMRRAHDDRVQRCLRCDIGDVAPPAAQRRVVLLECKRLSAPEFHRHLPPSALVGRLEGSCCPRRDAKWTATPRVSTD